MMRLILLAGAAALVAFSASPFAAVAGQAAASRSYPVSGFTAVELASSDDVEVRVGPAFSVQADGPAEILDRLVIERRGDALYIARKPGKSWSWSGKGARVHVTMPRIAAAKLSGSGDMKVDRVAGPRFAAALSGSGDLTIAGMAVDKADFALVGSGDVRASGTAGEMSAALKGSGDLRLGDLVARRAQVALSGSGDIVARVDGPAQVALAGSGDVDLGPGAQCQTIKAGSGSVRCGK
ncbi:MAG: DUF2807 domain-containing protein [Sphingomonas sp.]|nr:DUF2807 domain-containing protein [Sphingomonas sp.]